MDDFGFRPLIMPDPAAVSPGEETLGEVLSPARFHDLYRLVKEEGLPCFARLNDRGEAELFLVFESIDAFTEATSDQVTLEFKQYQSKLLAIVWTLNDPVQPLGFPLSFDVKKAEERYTALRLLEQTTVPLHYLVFAEERITHLFSEELMIAPEEKWRVENSLRHLYEEGEADAGSESAQERAPEVKEEQIASIPAVSLPDSVLTQTGLAYFFHFRAMAEKLGEEKAQDLLMGTLQQAVLVMRRHSRSDVRESAFTVWAAQQGEGCCLIVTPLLDHLFPVVHMAEEEANPFTRFLLALPDFVRTEEETPLHLGAFPILRYEAGKVLHLELDEGTQQHLANLFAHRFPAAANPYGRTP